MFKKKLQSVERYYRNPYGLGGWLMLGEIGSLAKRTS